MADPRTSSPLFNSPRQGGSLSRPHWPWSTYTHRSSQPLIPSPGGSTTGTPTGSWDPRQSVLSNPGTPSGTWSTDSAVRQNTGSTMGYPNNALALETTRQWSFTAFEWIVRDVQKLRDFVEGHEPTDTQESGQTINGHGDFEVLKESPMLGDGKFKLEIARTLSPENAPANPSKPQTLSLYITSLMLDFAHSDFETSASMMTAIKCQDDRAGERGARADWVWEFWQNDWTFRRESEVWECPLPVLSVLLQNARIHETDSFVICVQIHCPVGPFFPSQPSAHYVPRDLLDGLEASLDNPNTGDVQFICLERQHQSVAQTSPRRSSSDVTTPVSHRSSSSASSHSFFPSHTTARKRVIYAHSDILTRRSEHFATMLASAFSENTPGIVQGDRKLFSIVVEEAEFETVYWLLKWCYANWLLFKELDDPRVAVDGIGAGWSARWLNARGGDWEWKTFRKMSASEEVSTMGSRDDTRSRTSIESMRSNTEGSTTSSKGKTLHTITSTPSARQPSGTKAASSSKISMTSQGTSRSSNLTAPRQSVPSSSNASHTAMAVGMDHPATSSVSRTKTAPIPLSVPSNYSSPHYPLSPRSQRQHPHPPSMSTPDPHPHPTPAPPPASALSMYQVAHRYAMPGLATLALEHMMCTIIPQSSFALLLATSVWDELHSLIEDYVVEKWDEVSVSEEFEQCCQEVAAGEWGAQGGKTLTALFRRLRSPAPYPRS